MHKNIVKTLHTGQPSDLDRVLLLEKITSCLVENPALLSKEPAALSACMDYLAKTHPDGSAIVKKWQKHQHHCLLLDREANKKDCSNTVFSLICLSFFASRDFSEAKQLATKLYVPNQNYVFKFLSVSIFIIVGVVGLLGETSLSLPLLVFAICLIFCLSVTISALFVRHHKTSVFDAFLSDMEALLKSGDAAGSLNPFRELCHEVWLEILSNNLQTFESSVSKARINDIKKVLKNKKLWKFALLKNHATETEWQIGKILCTTMLKMMGAESWGRMAGLCNVALEAEIILLTDPLYNSYKFGCGIRDINHPKINADGMCDVRLSGFIAQTGNLPAVILLLDVLAQKSGMPKSWHDIQPLTAFPDTFTGLQKLFGISLDTQEQQTDFIGLLRQNAQETYEKLLFSMICNNPNLYGQENAIKDFTGAIQEACRQYLTGNKKARMWVSEQDLSVCLSEFEIKVKHWTGAFAGLNGLMMQTAEEAQQWKKLFEQTQTSCTGMEFLGFDGRFVGLEQEMRELAVTHQPLDLFIRRKDTLENKLKHLLQQCRHAFQTFQPHNTVE